MKSKIVSVLFFCACIVFGGSVASADTVTVAVGGISTGGAGGCDPNQLFKMEGDVSFMSPINVGQTQQITQTVNDCDLWNGSASCSIGLSYGAQPSQPSLSFIVPSNGPYAFNAYTSIQGSVGACLWTGGGSYAGIPFQVGSPATLNLDARSAFLRALSAPVFAQMPTTQTTAPEKILIADVEIPEAELTLQNKNMVTIAFALRGDTAQEDIRYGMYVYKKEGGEEVLEDMSIAFETLAIRKNELKNVSASFLIPQNISGEVSLYVVAQTTQGVTLAKRKVADIVLEKGNTSLVLEKCSNDAAKKTLTCNVKNTTSQTQTVAISATTRNGGYFGTDIGAPVIKEISLAKNKTTTVSFEMPEGTLSYTAEVTLFAPKTLEVYGKQNIQHIGEKSSLIRNMFIDVDPDTLLVAVVTNTQSIATQSFVRVYLQNGETSCGNGEMNVTSIRTDVELKPTCTRGVATIELVSKDGSIIDTKTTPFELPPMPAKTYAEYGSIVAWFFAALALSTAVFLAIRKIFAKNKGN